MVVMNVHDIADEGLQNKKLQVGLLRHKIARQLKEMLFHTLLLYRSTLVRMFNAAIKEGGDSPHSIHWSGKTELTRNRPKKNT
jgi:hypothetical protein